MAEVTEVVPARDRLDTAKLIYDFELFLRIGSVAIVDGRIVRTKLSQAQIAAALGVAAPYLSQVRHGTLRPQGNLALALMGLLNANVNDYLLPLDSADAA